MIKIIAIGRKHESWVRDGIERYQKRLRVPWSAEWILLPHSARQDRIALQEESERILNRLDESAYVVLLDERGKLLDSPTLATKVDETFSRSQPIVFVIGGAYGVNDALTQRANLVWALSSLVFPHQLVRLILTEQLYRAQQISGGAPYHHE